jgi:hypothetical protein
MERTGIAPKAMRGHEELLGAGCAAMLCWCYVLHVASIRRRLCAHAQELSLKNAEKLIERCIKWLGRLGDATARTSDHSKSRFRTPTLSQVCPQL